MGRGDGGKSKVALALGGNPLGPDDLPLRRDPQHIAHARAGIPSRLGAGLADGDDIAAGQRDGIGDVMPETCGVAGIDRLAQVFSVLGQAHGERQARVFAVLDEGFGAHGDEAGISGAGDDPAGSVLGTGIAADPGVPVVVADGDGVGVDPRRDLKSPMHATQQESALWKRRQGPDGTVLRRSDYDAVPCHAAIAAQCHEPHVAPGFLLFLFVGRLFEGPPDQESAIGPTGHGPGRVVFGAAEGFHLFLPGIPLFRYPVIGRRSDGPTPVRPGQIAGHAAILLDLAFGLHEQADAGFVVAALAPHGIEIGHQAAVGGGPVLQQVMRVGLVEKRLPTDAQARLAKLGDDADGLLGILGADGEVESMLEDVVAHPGGENVLLGLSGLGMGGAVVRDENKKAGPEEDCCTNDCLGATDIPAPAASRRGIFERPCAAAW